MVRKLGKTVFSVKLLCDEFANISFFLAPQGIEVTTAINLVDNI